MVGVVGQLLVCEFGKNLLPGPGHALMAKHSHVLVRPATQAVERQLVVITRGIVLPQLTIMLGTHVPTLVCAKFRQRYDFIARGTETNACDLLSPDSGADNGVTLSTVASWHICCLYMFKHDSLYTTHTMENI